MPGPVVIGRHVLCAFAWPNEEENKICNQLIHNSKETKEPMIRWAAPCAYAGKIIFAFSPEASTASVLKIRIRSGFFF